MIYLYTIYVGLLLLGSWVLWRQRRQFLTLDATASQRFVRLAVGFLLGDAVLTVGLLSVFGLQSVWPVMGLIVGSLGVPVLGFILISKLFN